MSDLFAEVQKQTVILKNIHAALIKLVNNLPERKS